MAAADPVRSRSRVPSDRSGSCSDDVVSLDSWSEKLEASTEWPVEQFVADSDSRSRLSSIGSGRSGLSRQLAARHSQFSDVKKEKSTVLRSGPPRPKSSSGGRNNSETISTISGCVQSGDFSVVSHRRPGSSTSSDSDSSPLHSPRQTSQDQSPTRKIPSSGTHFNGGQYHFAHHLHPHYLSSPLHRGSAGHMMGHGSRNTHQPHFSHSQSRGHQQRPHSHPHQHPHHSPHPHQHLHHSPHHRGLAYYGDGPFPDENNYQHFGNGNGAALDQILEREGEKLKTKMKSMWNNVKYGWTIKTKTSFKYDSPIFLLGRCYHRRAEVGEQQAVEMLPPQQQQYKVSALDQFHADFTSRLWFTYRREFAPIGSAKMTTDCGWGCMLRSGQMMMAQGLVQHFLRRDWKVYSEQQPEDLAFYREIIRWFGDYPSDKIPFSIHRLVELGTSVGKMPGDWYGPASVAHIFRDAMDKAHVSLPILSGVCTYVAQDCTIYLQDLMKVVTSHGRSNSQLSNSSDSEHFHLPPSSHRHHQPPQQLQQQQQQQPGQRSDSVSEERFRSVIILVPMRLGGETLNEIYIPCVQSMLAHDHCIGIIGGRPKHSLYFVGWQDDKLIYLDPHYCQDTVDTSQSLYAIQSFHCMSPRKMQFNKMDPSCTVGFYCRDRRELQTFIDQVPDMVVPPRQKGQYPLFVVSQGSSADQHSHQPPVRELGRLRIQHMRTDRTGNRVRSPTLDSDDFVIL